MELNPEDNFTTNNTFNHYNATPRAFLLSDSKSILNIITYVSRKC